MCDYQLLQNNKVYTLFKTHDRDYTLKLLITLIMSRAIYSIISDEYEVSIILNEADDELKSILSDLKMHSYLSQENTKYKCLEVQTELPMLAESGMLSTVTKFFADNHIPILCMSTYSCNYIFYPIEFVTELEQAVKKDKKYMLTNV